MQHAGLVRLSQMARVVATAGAIAMICGVPHAAPSHAVSSVVVSLPDFNGPGGNVAFPSDLGVIGTFVYTLPGGSNILEASIGGTFGTQFFPNSTAPFDIIIAGAQLAGCVSEDPCFQDNAQIVRPFDVVLPASTFTTLLTGSVDLGIIQTGSGRVRYGSPTLTIQYTDTVIPEPATWAMMIAGFGVIGLAARRRRALPA